ncbi:lipase family protein, partial [Helicobacter trogontum]
MSSSKDLFVADASLAIDSIPKAQYDDMINFYETCASNYPQIKEKDSLTLTGHSLGGALAQMLVLSICDDKNEANINEVYIEVYILYNNIESKIYFLGIELTGGSESQSPNNECFFGTLDS